MSKIKAFLLPILALLSFSACNGEKIVHWKQEVQLQDGRVIDVDRKSKRTGNLFPENVHIEYEQTLSLVNPDSKEKITWTIPKGTLTSMLDFDQGVPYLVLRTGSVADYNTWDCPNPPFIIYRYEKSEWQRIPIEQLPEQFTVPNLFLGYGTDEKAAADGAVTVAEMQKSIKESAKEFRTIYREKINSNVEGCFPSTLERLGRSDEITEKYYRKGDAK
jgi:hypothetical protein